MGRAKVDEYAEIVKNRHLEKHLWLERTDLDKHELTVALSIAWHRNSGSLQCNPGRGRLAKLTRLSKSTVDRAKKGLVEKDVMFIGNTNRGPKGLGRNNYLFIYDLADVYKIMRDGASRIEICPHILRMLESKEIRESYDRVSSDRG